MILDSADGFRVDNICVFVSHAEPGDVIDFHGSSSDSVDLFIYMKSGSASLRYDSTHILDIKTTGYIPRGSEYAVVFTEESEYILVSFKLFRYERRINLPHEMAFTADLSNEFAELEKTISLAGMFGDLARRQAFWSMLTKAGAELLAFFVPGLARIAPGVAAMQQEFLENKPIAEYAEMCGLRENRFRMLFTDYFKTSPVEYRNTMRMRYAQKLLTNLHCSVSDAAKAAGFASTSYFCRLHRKMYGVSPAEMENDHAKMV